MIYAEKEADKKKKRTYLDNLNDFTSKNRACKDSLIIQGMKP